MAIQLLGMPQVRIDDPGLNAAPLTRAIQGYTAGVDAATQFENRKAVGQTAAGGDLRAAAKQALGLGETELGMQYQRQAGQDEAALKKRLGSMAQAVEMEADPRRRAAMWQRVLKAVPGGGANLAPEEMDPMTGPKMLMAEAGIVVDPLDRRQKEGALQLQQAQIAKMNRDAASGGDMPSNVREWQFFQRLPAEQQQRYLTMKRAEQWKDIGTGYANAADPSRVIQKDLRGAEVQKGEGQNIAKIRADLPEAKTRLDLVMGNLNRLKNSASNLLTMPGLDSVVGGLPQAYVPNVREDSINAQTELENLKVKISGTVLQAMRDASKTGGAVGQVTEREWPRLENMIANLDPRQGRAQFARNVQAVMAYADQVMAAVQAAYEADLRTAQGGQMPQTAPARPDPLGILGGN